MDGEILFLAHRIPFPPDRGDKIRSHHLLKALAQLAPVHVACLSETDGDRAQGGELAEVSASYCLAHRSKPLALAGIEAMLSGKPVSLTAFHHARIADFVRATLAERPIKAIFVFSGQMGQYIPENFEGQVVVDLCDVDSAKFEAYAAEKGGPRGWVDARENRLLAIEEERLAHRADTTLLISDAEAALLKRRLANPAAVNIRSLGNGIDAEFFDPAKVTPHEDLSSRGPHFVFTGQMDYTPNLGACLRAAQNIVPLIRQTQPDTQFHIVGRAPTPELTALDRKNGIRVWGEVPDVRPFLAAADAILAPLTIARGVQNKVLEAMAMAKPVVLSPEAATGIEAIHGEHVWIGPDDAALIEGCLALSEDRERANEMGRAARQFVVDQKSWPAALADLPALMGFRPKAEARDAA